MKSRIQDFPFYLIVVLITATCLTCGNKPPFTADYKNVKGFIIGRENCNPDSTKENWLIDLTYLPNTPPYGDTLVLNNQVYTNVVKTKDLSDTLKKVGIRVSIDFKTISEERMLTTGCTLSNPVTYPLKQLFILHQFEIR